MPEKTRKGNALENDGSFKLWTAFDCLYEKSKQNISLVNLYELIVSEENIQLALHNIRRHKGGKRAGVGGHTIRHLEQWSTEKGTTYVNSRLSRYQPQRVKRVEVSKTREIGVPTIEERLVQQCIKQVLEPICEAKFYEHSYGFRPCKDHRHGIARYKGLMDGGRFHIVDIEIKDFFHQMDHNILLGQMRKLGILDEKVLDIISKMLKAEVIGFGRQEKGLMAVGFDCSVKEGYSPLQDGILTPLFSNIVLNELDWWIVGKGQLRNVWIVRYADDFKLVCENRQDAKVAYEETKKWLKDKLNLEINEEKSKVVDLRSHSSEFLGFGFRAFYKTGIEEGGISNWRCSSYITGKAKKKIKLQLKNQLLEIQKCPTYINVERYNSIVLGIHFYYGMAASAPADFLKISGQVSSTIHKRLKTVVKFGAEASSQFSEVYKQYYREDSCICEVDGVHLFPIADVLHFQADDVFFQNRHLIEQAEMLDVLRHLMDGYDFDRSFELHQNRQTVYIRQSGLCEVTKVPLRVGEMALHHICPTYKGGGDMIKNLVYLLKPVHELIHADEIRYKNLTASLLDNIGLILPNTNRQLNVSFQEILSKVNAYRVRAGNKAIFL